MNENIVNKIKKLLSLSTSPNKAEANAAYQKAMELMVKHNIELINTKEKNYGSNVRHSNIETLEIKFIHEILVGSFFTQIVQRRVYCDVDKRLKNRYTYYASHANLQISMYVFDFLMKEFPIMWRVAKRKEGFTQKHKQSYYYGVSQGFNSIFKEVKNYSENKYEMVLTEVDPELSRFIKERHNKLKTAKVNVGPVRKDAFTQGVEDGKDLKINQALETKNKSKTTLAIGSK